MRKRLGSVLLPIGIVTFSPTFPMIYHNLYRSQGILTIFSMRQAIRIQGLTQLIRLVQLRPMYQVHMSFYPMQQSIIAGVFCVFPLWKSMERTEKMWTSLGNLTWDILTVILLGLAIRRVSGFQNLYAMLLRRRRNRIL